MFEKTDMRNSISPGVPGLASRISSTCGTPYPTFEFHILRSIRNQYDLDDALFSLTGNMVFIDFHAVRVLAHKMNSRRDLIQSPHLAVKTGALNAMGLIDEIYHYILQLYERSINPGVFQRALESLGSTVGKTDLHKLLAGFTEIFPPTGVYRNIETVESYLESGTMGKSNAEIIIEEVVHVYFANFNPAIGLFRELFDDEQLKIGTPYETVVTSLDKFFRQEKKFGSQGEDIFTLLRAPILASPNSLEGQLAFIRKYWGTLLSDVFLERMTLAGDLMKEDLRVIFPGGGPVPTHVPRYTGDEFSEYLTIDEEHFTPDTEWMPNVVLLAKNAYVWLGQLSKKYQRAIQTLDQIPDEELDLFARWHFTGLWLIGIWERSRSSQRIKQMTGNPEAVSSAYSLYDYDIAVDLGGEEAFQNLRHRAWQRGIRLAGDMVPNHVGLYSRWVVEHPEYFIQSPYSPFPNYRFTGENLSDHPSVEVRIEDGYWSRSDAAVVFQRIDRTNGNVAYLYHGNDGTNMPWNDTAQLDFLRKDVREAVIQAILHVAKKFPIIRFDAAMVLAKKHFQRLWYPEPGTGGAIPSRADHAMTRKDFDAVFPQEFWREVVDRINTGMPNTLLLAEAFWLLEGYFVRTLGMHRVYNSAFMHMLMNEENGKYRELIRNTLHYNPEILKRYVNFMSNPDEKTAVEQFGKGDKYAGIATMMVTLPGLPMFAHGQVEGYTEKYGMEYRRAYYDEQPDNELIRRHEREIFPLMNRRHLFSQVTHFEMYDFITPHGRVDENVFAFSNQHFSERAFVCFHNRYAETEGYVNFSSGKVGKEGEGTVYRTTFGQKFGFRGEPNLFYLFKDHTTGLEFLRSGKMLVEQGFFMRLRAYEFHVFLDIQEVWDGEGIFARVLEQLGNNGVPDVWHTAKRLRLQDAHNTFAEIFGAPDFQLPDKIPFKENDTRHADMLSDKFVAEVVSFVYLANRVAHLNLNSERIKKDLVVSLANVRDAIINSGLLKDFSSKRPPTVSVFNRLSDIREQRLLVLWLFLRTLSSDDLRIVREDLLLDEALRKTFSRTGYSDPDVEWEVVLVQQLLRRESQPPEISEDKLFLHLVEMLNTDNAREYIRLHDHEGVRYYHKESFERLVSWLGLCRWIDGMPYRTPDGDRKAVNDVRRVMKNIFEFSDAAHYNYDTLITSFPNKNIR
jgi:glycosidase